MAVVIVGGLVTSTLLNLFGRAADVPAARAAGPLNNGAGRSAGPAELRFDLVVGGRVWRKLVQGRVEEALGVFVSTLAAADEGKVRDHLSLVLLVP
jgi:hypothetical protein